MKRRQWIFAAWLAVTLLLLALAAYLVVNLIQGIQEDTLQHLGAEISHFVALGTLFALTSAGFYHELRQSPRE